MQKNLSQNNLIKKLFISALLILSNSVYASGDVSIIYDALGILIIHLAMIFIIVFKKITLKRKLLSIGIFAISCIIVAYEGSLPIQTYTNEYYLLRGIMLFTPLIALYCVLKISKIKSCKKSNVADRNKE